MCEGTLVVTGQKHPFPGRVIFGAQLYLDPLIVVMGLQDCTEEDSAAFAAGRLTLYLREIDELISLVLRVEGLGWSESLFTMQSSQSSELPAPPTELTQGYAIHVVLVDCDTQIVYGQRFIGVSQEFSQGLYAVWLRNRNNEPLSTEEFEKRAAVVQQRFESPQAISRGAQFKYTTVPHKREA
jgi:hypothetical protein